MNKGEAKVLETDVVIFPMQFGQAAARAESVKEPESEALEKEKTAENAQEIRFARLRKSLRKRSVSIL